MKHIEIKARFGTQMFPVPKVNFKTLFLMYTNNQISKSINYFEILRHFYANLGSKFMPE